jgi:beta-glucosidase
MLGPGVNLARVPWNGRNFEYLGEDPHLASRMVYREVEGIQSVPISGCVKHFVDNNQEYDRSGVSANVPDRAQWELYYQAFGAAVEAGVGSAMCSYNRVNGTWACENANALGALKGKMGFRGWVMSDWGATHSTVPAALGGLDQQMPDNSFFGDTLAAAVANGTVPASRIDDMVMRMLTPMYALGLIDNPPTGNINNNALSVDHNTLARTLSEASQTLLKNSNNVLPLNLATVQSIAVFGDETTVHGDGSGGVITPYVVTPFEGIYNLINPSAKRIANCTYYPNTDFYQPGNPCVSAASQEDCCAKCTASLSCNAFAFVNGSTCSNGPADAGAASACWLKPNTDGQKVSSGIVGGVCFPLPPSKIPVTYNDGTNVTQAVALAQSAQIAIVVVATSSSEGSDRTNLSLPAWQDALVAAVAAVNPNTIVVARCPGACFMPWRDLVSGIIYQGMPGQEAGNSLANLLFNVVPPQGKLPVSFPASMTDTWLGNPVNPLQYPGTDRGRGFLEVDYSEGLFFGYRWYDAQGTDPLWAFGHGLSYTTWTYNNLDIFGTVSSATAATINLDVTNTGSYYGAETVQLYVSYPAAANEPPKLLKGFQKIFADVGIASSVSFMLDARSLSIWDVTVQDFVLIPGTYNIMIASSSRDIRLTGSVTVTN